MAFLPQRLWRIVGGVALAVCAGMAVYGRRIDPAASATFFLVYWAGFLFFLVLALGMAMIDLRQARSEYVKAKQELFRETLGDEKFRRALSEAHRKSRQGSPKKK